MRNVSPHKRNVIVRKFNTYQFYQSYRILQHELSILITGSAAFVKNPPPNADVSLTRGLLGGAELVGFLFFKFMSACFCKKNKITEYNTLSKIIIHTVNPLKGDLTEERDTEQFRLKFQGDRLPKIKFQKYYKPLLHLANAV